ncbi:MAG TPA: glycosyltransferase family 39 protein, partial [Elusimicrobiales bacterium]|nr:glycosyltransferase family 39 protein [Elusimicrobiales bacterium]
LFHADAMSFDSLAWNLAENGRYGIDGPTAVRPPAYPFFLAGVYRLAGHDYGAARAAQALLGVLLVWMLMRIAGRLSEKPVVPVFAGAAAAFYPFFIYYDNQLLSDSFLTFSMTLSLLAFIRWKERPLSWGRAILCGLAFALTALVKTPMLPWALWILLAEAVLSREADARGPRLRRVLAVGLALSLPLALWAARNRRSVGSFSLDNHGGFTLVSTIIYHQQTKAGVFGDSVRNDPFFLEAAELPETERERYYYGAARRFISEHPGRYIRECAVRFKDLWRFYPRTDVGFREGTSRLVVVSLLTEPFLVLCGLFSLFFLLPARRLMYPAPLAVLWLTLLHTLITGQMRYRLPLMPFLILGAAYLVPLVMKRSRD